MNEQGRKQSTHLFKKGTSGNPAGRPRGAKSRTTLLKEGMEADWLKFLRGVDDPSDKDKVTRWDRLMSRVYTRAMNDDPAALRLIMQEVHKDLRAHNAQQAKQTQGPRSVTVKIKTEQVAIEAPEKEIQGEVIENED